MSTEKDPARTQFAETLSAAIQAGTFTLEQLSRRLRELGTPLSTATLSYWCSGRSVPARARSRQAVTHLERLLDLPPGHLVSALPGALNARWSPGVGIADLSAVQASVARLGLDLDRHLEARMVTDEVTIAQGGRQVGQTTHQLHWADGADVTSFPVILPLPHPRARLDLVEASQGARVEAHEVVPSAGVVVMKLCLDQPLHRGDLGQVRYDVVWTCPEPVTHHTRRLPITLGRLALAIRFEDDEPPAVDHVHVAPDGVTTRTALSGPGQVQVQVCLAEAGAGLHRLEW